MQEIVRKRPNLQALIEQAGGYDKISIQQWEVWDLAMAQLWEELTTVGWKRAHGKQNPWI